MEEVKFKVGLEHRSFSEGAEKFGSDTKKMKEAVDGLGVDLNDLDGSIKKLGSAASAAADKFRESTEAANKLKGELKGLTESGASAEEILGKARELGEAQKKAANDGAEALRASQKYWTALGVAGDDISEVRTKHQELAASYTEMASRAKVTQSVVEDYSRKLNEEKERLKDVKDQSDKTKESTDNLKDSTKKAADGSKGFADKLGEVSSGAKGLPGPVGAAVSSVNGLTKATLRFIATPIGATLAAISGALALVTSWFKRTEEGQNALAVGSAYFAQILNSVLDVADDVGEWLHKAFTKPKSAMMDLVEFLKGQVINRIKAVGEMAQGIWKILNGDFSDGFQQFSNGWLQSMTGVQNVTGKVSAWMSDANRKADERVKITQRQNELDRKERENLVEKAKLEARISQLREKAYDKSVSEKDRSKAIKEAQTLTTKLYDQEVRLARERYEIIRDTNKLSHSNKEDKKKEAEAEAELYRLEAQRATALKSISREQNRVDSSAASAARSTSKQAKQEAKTRQKLFEEDLRMTEEQARQRQATEYAIAEANIASIKSAAERERAEQLLQHKKNLDSVKAREEEMKKATYESNKRIWEANNKDSKQKYSDTAEGKAGWQDIKLTEDQLKELQALRDKYNAENSRQIAERQKEELQAIRDYIKEFGTVQERRYAIQKEYDDKIAAETNELRQKQLEAEKEKALNALDIEVLRTEIDWTTMFDGIGNALEEEMKSTLEKVEKYMKSSQYKSLSAQEKAEYVKLRNELYKKTGSGVGAFDFSIYNQIGEDMKAYQHAVRAAKIAENDHTNALRNLDVANDELAKARERLAKAEPKDWAEANRQYLEAVAKVQRAQNAVNTTGQQQNDAQGNVVDAKGNLEKSTSAASDTINKFASALNEMNDGTLYGFANGLANLIHSITGGSDGNAVGGLIGAIGSKAGGLIGAILQIIDALGDDPAGFFQGILEKVASAVDKILSTLLTEIVPTVLEGVGKIIAALIEGIANLVSFGAAGSLFSPEEDGYKEMISQFENLRDIWDEIIEKKKDYLSQSWGDEAKKAAEEAIRIAQEAQARARALANESLDYGASAGSRSIGYRMWEKGSYGDWKGNARNIVSGLKAAGLGDADTKFNSMYDMSAMTAKQLEWIRDNYRDLWIQLDEDYRASLENVIQYGQTVLDVEKQLQEQLSGASFDTVFDSAMESMYDLADGSEDVMDDIAESWQKMVNKMIVSGLIGNKMKAELQKWYDDEFTKVYDEGLSDEEIARREKDAKDSYDRIIGHYSQQVKDAKDKGLISPLPTKDDEKEALEYFDSIRDAWVNTIMEMKGDSKSLGKDIAKIMFENLVKSNIFNEDFDNWLKDWVDRYNAALEVKAPGERESRLNQLYQERTDKVEELTKETEKYADATGYSAEATEGLSNSLDNLGDTLLDSLLDSEKTAEDMGKEIAMSLIKEMLSTMLASDKYADRIGEIRKKWQKLLSGEAVDYTMDDVLNDISELNNDIASDESITKLADQYKALNKEAEKTDTVFSSLRDTFKDTLYSMEDDADSFKKKLSETMLKDLIDKQVLDVPFTINGMTFDNFEAYSKDWNKRYAKAVADGDTAMLDQLIDELVKARDLTIDAAEEFRNRIKELQKSEDTTFNGMTDSFVSALMDMNTDADAWGQEIGKTIARRIVEQMFVARQIQPMLDNLQAAMDAAFAKDGATYKTVMDDSGVKAMLERIKNEYPTLQEAVEEIYKSLGVDYEKDNKEDEKKEGFSDLRGSFVSALTDMEGDAKKFGKSIAKTMQEQMLNALIDNKYGKQMEKLNEDWAEALEAGDTRKLESIRQAVVRLYATIGNDKEIKKLSDDFKQVDEVLADTPLGNLRSSILDTYMSLEDDTRAFGEDLTKILTEAMIDKFVLGDAFDSKLKEWEKEYRRVMGDPKLSEKERAEALKQLKQTINSYQQQQKEEAKAIQDFMGYTGSHEDQSVYMNTAQSISYDQADIIGGGVTSLVMGQNQGNEVRRQILATLKSMSGLTQPGGDYGQEISNRIAASNEYLRAIRDYTQNLVEIKNGINSIKQGLIG